MQRWEYFLVNLIVLGNPDSDCLADMLYRALTPHFSVAAIRTDGRIEGCCGAADFLLFESSYAKISPFDANIILCRRSFVRCGGVFSGKNTVGIVQSDNRHAIHALSRTHIPVISCGMSVTDTLTCSSLQPDSACICLQRSIPTLSGSLAEPMEIPLSLSRPYDSYALMCLAGILVLCGQSPSRGLQL